MNFYVFKQTYDSYGGHPTLTLIPEFLLDDAGDFGTAIVELTVTLHFTSSGPFGRNLASTGATITPTLAPFSTPVVLGQLERVCAARK